MAIVLLFAASLVSDTVTSRQESWNQILQGITATWAGPQDIIGPILMVPVKISDKDVDGKVYKQVSAAPPPLFPPDRNARLSDKGSDGKVRERSSIAWFLPDQLSMEGTLDTEVLRHGICKTSGYSGELKLSGAFPADLSATLAQRGAAPQWDQAKIVMGISDLRGIKNEVFLDWDKSEIPMGPGTGDEGFKDGSLHAKLKGAPQGSAPFALTIKLRGSRQLHFVPLGKTTTLQLKSPWPSPEFIGRFFPDSKEVAADGFRASWKILYINRNLPQFWVGEPRDMGLSRFGVDFQIPVDYYRATSRAIQYAVMFIVLTFLVFFFVEFFLKQKLHPIQYLLAGAGIVLFYLLLLSLAEHLPFPAAYALAGAAIVAVITSYTQWIFHRRGASAAVGGILIILYSFFYTLLQMEDYSLLAGSLGLLTVLGLIMYLTRNFDWFHLERLGGEPAAGPASGEPEQKRE